MNYRVKKLVNHDGRRNGKQKESVGGRERCGERSDEIPAIPNEECDSDAYGHGEELHCERAGFADGTPRDVRIKFVRDGAEVESHRARTPVGRKDVRSLVLGDLSLTACLTPIPEGK
jgi:hypothetical protein